MDESDLALRRDKAAAALLFLSGMRAGALVSLTIDCVDVVNRTIKQWPTLGVKTKNRKSATTNLLNIPELLTVVESWDSYIRARLPLTAYNGPKNSDTKDRRNKVVKCHHAKTLF